MEVTVTLSGHATQPLESVAYSCISTEVSNAVVLN